MSRLLFVVIATCVTFSFNINQAISDDNKFNITEFYEQVAASQRMSLKMTGSEEPVPVVILFLDQGPARLMKIFDDDVCVTAVTPDDNFIAYFTCRSGAEMKVSFTCRNNCYMQGEHSEKGKWKDIYNYRINQNMPLEEILGFAGRKDTEVTKTKAIEPSSSWMMYGLGWCSKDLVR